MKHKKKERKNKMKYIHWICVVFIPRKYMYTQADNRHIHTTNPFRTEKFYRTTELQCQCEQIFKQANNTNRRVAVEKCNSRVYHQIFFFFFIFSHCHQHWNNVTSFMGLKQWSVCDCPCACVRLGPCPYVCVCVEHVTNVRFVISVRLLCMLYFVRPHSRKHHEYQRNLETKKIKKHRTKRNEKRMRAIYVLVCSSFFFFLSIAIHFISFHFIQHITFCCCMWGSNTRVYA